MDNNLKSNIIKSNKIILNRSNARINYDENNINPIDKYLPNKVYFLKQRYLWCVLFFGSIIDGSENVICLL